MELPKIIKDNIETLYTVCKQYNVSRLYLFGSAITSRFDSEKSDLDFQVILKPMSPLDKGATLLNFWTALEVLFERKVDLITDQPIKNPFLAQHINDTKLLIYDREGKKIAS